MKDPDVYLQQVTLQSLGFYRGILDGDPGPQTRAAKIEWLKSISDHSPSLRKISTDGLDLVRHFEGCYLTAYLDTGKVWTIGWGHTGLIHRDGTVHSGRKISSDQAVELLKYDMGVFEKRVTSLVKVELNDDEFSALVSFDFNTGGLGSSTLLKKLNAGNRSGAADEFLRWVYDDGVKLAGLVRRRKSERNLFLGKRPFIIPA